MATLLPSLEVRIGRLKRTLDTRTYAGRIALRSFAYAMNVLGDDDFAAELLEIVGKEG